MSDKRPPLAASVIRFNCEHKKRGMDDEVEFCKDCGQVTCTFVEEYPKGFFD